MSRRLSLLGVGVRNVTLRGSGRIDGNSPAFFLDAEGKTYRNYHAIPFRPAQMVWFVDSQDIRITDLELADSPYWSCFILNCDRVWIRAGTVRRPSRIYARKTRPFENIAFWNVELPCGFVGVNADVRITGGTFAPKDISAEERARIEEDIANVRNRLY